MNLATLRPRTQLLVALVLPLCCLPVGLYLVWHPVAELRRVTQEIDVTQQIVASKTEAIRLAEQAASGRPLALAVAKPAETEPALFVREFDGLLEESGARLVSVQATKLPPIPVVGAAPTQPKPAADPGGENQPAAAAPPAVGGQRPVLPATVNEISDSVTVAGDFGAVLALMLRLENYERILSVSSLKLTQDTRGKDGPEGQVRATFTLSRYTSIETPARVGGAARPAGAAGPGSR